MEDLCVKYRSELSALVDGQLETKVQTEMHAHIADCENCSQEFETLKSLGEFLGQNMFSADVAVPEIWDLLQQALPLLCEVMRDDLSSFIDNELPPPAHEGVDKHLKECLPCLGSYKELNNVSKLISKGLELPASVKVDLWPAVKARLNEDCALIQVELSAYADQEVEILRHRTITKHLVDCAECKLSFESISSVGEVLRDSYKPPMVEEFNLWPQVKRQLQVVPITLKTEQNQQQPTQTSAKSKFKSPRFYMASAAAMVVLMVASMGIVNMAKHKVVPLSSEAYLIDSAMSQPTEIAEAVVYDAEQ